VSTQFVTWLDGAPASSLPLPDRGLDYGDGLFETLLLKQGRPLYQELHLQRMSKGLQTLDFPDCLPSIEKYLDTACRDVEQRAWPWAVLRLTLTRGSGPRGYTPPEVANPRAIITVSQLDRNCDQLSPAAILGVATVRCSSQPLLAGIKHLNRLEQVLAASECRAKNTDEAVMLDQSDHLSSVAAGNLFLVQGRKLLTPALLDCGVAGTRRSLVMDKWAPALGLAVQESILTLQDLIDADEVFYSNSLHGVRPVAQLGERCWEGHSVCERLFQQYREEWI
jgi:4-amino-4-deoxychorismate lyase